MRSKLCAETREAATPSHEQSRRRRSYLIGHAAEYLAAVLLWFKGYRVLARRFRARGGEIDLIAVRGDVIAFVEVKFRQSQHEARAALTDRNAERLSAASSAWLARTPRYRRFEQRLDAMLLVPWSWPEHLEGGMVKF
jgi:putative endonuclease